MPVGITFWPLVHLTICHFFTAKHGLITLITLFYVWGVL